MPDTTAEPAKMADDGFKLVQRRPNRKRKMAVDEDEDAKIGRPLYPPAKHEKLEGKAEIRKVLIPPHRRRPLKENWTKIFMPIVEHLHLQTRFNQKTHCVEIRTCRETEEPSALQKAADFVRAFAMGFDVDDALALIRLDELFLESFEIGDVKTLKRDHMARCIGRVAGKSGRTKFTIENVTKTRIVLADKKVHILGSYQNIRAARTAICNLVLGKPPSKVYGTMRQLANRIGERF
uniref:Putative rna-binding protein pno1p n=1 Tax=Rhipicephalus pulchellus TaxID=72859 RepID=L7M541_RHIPC